MKVLHITNEFTKKNFSISSLIIYISKYLLKKYKVNSSILTSKLEKDLFDNEKIKIFDFKSWFATIFVKNRLRGILSEYDVIHIHGIWAPIQLISLLICLGQKKKCIIHPHGMLLKEALKSAGYLKYLFKKLTLFLLQKIINNQLSFISITSQETNAIKEFFPNIKIDEISNPVPFEKNSISNIKKKKKIVYFGRIHPHKNIHLVINSFLKANLDNEWILEIYGIKDDSNYFNYLNKIIGKNNQIKIKEPVFGLEKQKIMSESWLNILVSKSEVLSLSILESSLFGLPTLVNKDIEVKGFEKGIVETKIDVTSISEKINIISNWTADERQEIEKNIIKDAKIQNSIESVSQKYNTVYKDLSYDKKYSDYKETSDLSVFGLIRKNFNFFVISSAYMFNLMFASLLVVSFVVLGEYSIAGELGLVTSFWITLTQIFSSNMRSIIISEDRILLAKQSLAYRFLFSIFILSIFLFLSEFYFLFENQALINATSCLIMVQWINEMSLVQYEVKNKNYYFKNFLSLNLVAMIFTGYFLFTYQIQNLNNVIYCYILIIIVLNIVNFLNNFNLKNYDFKSLITLNLKTIAFLSSFSIIISSFAWRIMIYFIFDKSLAGIFFACFSIGSFPGTLFNSVIGPAFIKQKIRVSEKLKKLFLFIFLLIISGVIFSIYSLYQVSEINYLGKEFIVFTISLSLIGSYFMSYAMYLRHKQIQTSTEIRKYLFKRDILYGISITFLIPILYVTGGTVAVSFAFIIASFCAMISYSLNLPPSPPFSSEKL